MKVLVVCQHFYPEEFRINDICYELVKKGHNVTVLTGLPNYPKGKVYKDYRLFRRRSETVNGVKIIRSFLIGRGNTNFKMALNYACFAVMASIKSLFIKKNFDVIYVYQLSPISMAWPAILLKKLTKKKIVLHCLDQWPISLTIGNISKNSFVYKIALKLSIWTYKRADFITISSKSFKKYFIKELKIVNKGLKYWPSYAESTYEVKQKQKDKTFDLLFAGNIGPAQSVETIIETARILKNNKNIMFHIVGDGLSKKSCEELTNKYELNNVKFYGFHPVEAMPNFYSMADAFLITMADNEIVNNTLPAKVQSYMLAGKPIIGAINGEVKEVINAAKCGLCCDSLNFKELSELIFKASKDKKSLITWGNNAKNYYDHHFTKDKCIKSLEKILYNVIEDKFD
ncbi:MAG: glycosyltransferase family 4 protein [Bacilli bacterium]